MVHPLSRRLMVVATAAASSLALVATIAAPSVAGASAHTHGAKSHGTVVRLEKSKKYGRILADGSGKTLYFLTTTKGKSFACKGSCTSLWPPLLTNGKPRAGKGLDAKLLGSVKRGSARQVTYDGHRLYRFASDSGTGQANGEGIKAFGGTWFVLSGKGSPANAVKASSRSGSRASSGYGGYGY